MGTGLWITEPGHCLFGKQPLGKLLIRQNAAKAGLPMQPMFDSGPLVGHEFQGKIERKAAQSTQAAQLGNLLGQ
jgi:hypothetical protein